MTASEVREARRPASILRDLDACLQCGYCRNVCPVFEESPWESASPRGKVYYLRQLYRRSVADRVLRPLGRRYELDQTLVDRLYWCTSCGMCEVACHVGIPFPSLWEEAKAWTVQSGLGPLKAHRAFLSRVQGKHNPFDEDPAKRADWAAGMKLSDRPEVVYYVGCTESFRMQRIAQATARVLEAAGVPFSIMGGDEWCCTSPLLRTGQRSELRSHAQHTRELMQKSGAKVMVTACAGCYVTTKRDHSAEIGPHPFELMHVAQYVDRLLAEGRLKFNRRVDRTVTYHDPCHLGRHGGVYDAPRNVMRAIPGLRLVEMPRSREHSRCCGAGAGYKAQFNDNAEHIAAGRVMEAKATGATEIITCCPFCAVNLNAGAKRAGVDLPTRDLLELVLEALGPGGVGGAADRERDQAVSPAVC